MVLLAYHCSMREHPVYQQTLDPMLTLLAHNVTSTDSRAEISFFVKLYWKDETFSPCGWL